MSTAAFKAPPFNPAGGGHRRPEASRSSEAAAPRSRAAPSSAETKRSALNFPSVAPIPDDKFTPFTNCGLCDEEALGGAHANDIMVFVGRH
jgi:hypothetical protein